MAYLQYEGVGIMALAAAVPRRVIRNREYTEVFSREEAEEIVDKTGIEERRFADEDTCSSDLCFAAAEKLHVMDCILCGSCAYECPSRRWLTPSFKFCKDHITAEAKAKAAAAAAKGGANK